MASSTRLLSVSSYLMIFRNSLNCNIYYIYMAQARNMAALRDTVYANSYKPMQQWTNYVQKKWGRKCKSEWGEGEAQGGNSFIKPLYTKCEWVRQFIVRFTFTNYADDGDRFHRRAAENGIAPPIRISGSWSLLLPNEKPRTVKWMIMDAGGMDFADFMAEHWDRNMEEIRIPICWKIIKSIRETGRENESILL